MLSPSRLSCFALVLLSLLQCGLSLLVFQTSAYVENESLPLYVFANQRPEDAVNDFVLTHSSRLPNSDSAAAEILAYICPLMSQNAQVEGYEELFVRCDPVGQRAPRRVVHRLDMRPYFPSSPSLVTHTLNLREKYPASFYVPMICDQVLCDKDGERDLLAIIQSVLNGAAKV